MESVDCHKLNPLQLEVSARPDSAQGAICLTLFRLMVGKMFVEFAEFTWCVLSRANLTPADEADSDSNSVPTLATIPFRI